MDVAKNRSTTGAAVQNEAAEVGKVTLRAGEERERLAGVVWRKLLLKSIDG